ncbi:(d)CMP kinase [Gulosibacter sp. ACHW.36C]|uniref:Cytidylate kinase n=1 Tax=Gulosibacter sediminis TaxID=1729695 RepID=A0ABY4MUB7_9MICO|nr:(d)CMP kinase [Gulosibacter sediminis]UQN14013.1 (d)CMP kinase [Gulosibacter sediminis]
MTATVVAIDGPAGSGKSTVSREVARRLGWQLLDTGSVYRAITWFGLQRGADLDDARAIIALMPAFLDAWRLSLDPDESWVRVGDDDITGDIRTTEISANVSKVARIIPVREAVNERFRELLFGSAAAGIVAEGRDITTVVAPDANVRILLTADETERIRRRQAELAGDDAAAVAATVAARDARDSQVVNFTSAADGVTVIDSTHLDLDAVIDAVLELIRERSGS